MNLNGCRLPFEIFRNLQSYGYSKLIPDISGLDMANIHTYVKPKVDMKENWDEVPEEIKAPLTA